MGFPTVAINRGMRRRPSHVSRALTSTSTARQAAPAKPNGKLVAIAADHSPLQFSADELVFGRKSVAGWYSGDAKDSEETMAFAVLKAIRPVIETHPLETAEATFQNINKARYRAVLTI